MKLGDYDGVMFSHEIEQDGGYTTHFVVLETNLFGELLQAIRADGYEVVAAGVTNPKTESNYPAGETWATFIDAEELDLYYPLDEYPDTSEHQMEETAKVWRVRGKRPKDEDEEGDA